jgi:hypothetical protein
MRPIFPPWLDAILLVILCIGVSILAGAASGLVVSAAVC